MWHPVRRGVAGSALVACALAWSGAALAAVDVCAIYRQHAPKDMGLALDRAMAPTPEFCQAASPGNRDTLMLHVAKMSSAERAIANVKGTRASAGGERIADEPGLGTAAWSRRDGNSIEITFAAKDQFVIVTLDRKGGLTEADAARAREFARAVAKSL